MLHYTTYNIPEKQNEGTGPNRKWLWLVLGQPLTPTTEELLKKICAALNADLLEDCFLLELDGNDPLLFTSFRNHQVKLIISFDVMPDQIGIWIDLKAPGIKHLEAFSFILAGSLEELSKSQPAKKHLWKSMQTYLERQT